MRLQLLSDLHLEFHEDPVAFCQQRIEIAPALDFLVLAGDIVVPSRQSTDVVQGVFDVFSKKAKHILFVTGNHCYYGGTKKPVEEQIQKILPANYHWLYNEDTILEGVHFFGGTMWFDYDHMNAFYKRQMNDFSQIAQMEDWVYLENRAFTEAAFSKVRPESVVISHHLPHPQSTPERFRGSTINRFFVSYQAKLIEEKQPRLWLHGHTHDGCDYRLGETRVLCNPLGYPAEHPKQKYPPVVLEV
jgi:Icc-related predicted phosphoesterase